jgi:hypothetical protein
LPPAESARERSGVLLISLDFELHWGVRDQKTIADYRDNLLGERAAVPALLRIFSEYGMHATWATVGFLFFENREQLLRGLPAGRTMRTGRSTRTSTCTRSAITKRRTPSTTRHR